MPTFGCLIAACLRYRPLDRHIQAAQQSALLSCVWKIHGERHCQKVEFDQAHHLSPLLDSAPRKGKNLSLIGLIYTFYESCLL